MEEMEWKVLKIYLIDFCQEKNRILYNKYNARVREKINNIFKSKSHVILLKYELNSEIIEKNCFIWNLQFLRLGIANSDKSTVS